MSLTMIRVSNTVSKWWPPLSAHSDFLILWGLLAVMRVMCCFWFYTVPWSETRDFHYRIFYAPRYLGEISPKYEAQLRSARLSLQFQRLLQQRGCRLGPQVQVKPLPPGPYSGWRLQGQRSYRIVKKNKRLYLLEPCGYSHKIPYVDYWLEYPPLFPAYLQQVARLLNWYLPNYDVTPAQALHHFQVAASLALLPFELGSLLLLYLIMLELHGAATAKRITSYWPLLFFPLFVSLSYFDFMPLFFMLAGIYSLLRGKTLVAGLSVGLGIMVKIIPVILIPVACTYLPNWRRRILFLLLVTTVCLVVLAPLVQRNPQFSLAFFTVNMQRPPWETIWALLDSQYNHGSLYELPRTMLPPHVPPGHVQQSIYPWCALPILLILFAGCRHAWRATAQHSWPPLFLLATCLFFIYAKGWSPQFIIFLIAPICFHFKPLLAIGILLLFSVINFVEMPIWLYHYPDSITLLGCCVITRTLLLVALAFKSYHDLAELEKIPENNTSA